MGSYVTNTSLTTTLGSYVTNTSLTTTLGSYVTNTSLTTTLGSYVTSSSLTTTLGNYMPKSGGTFTGNITLGTNSLVFTNPSSVSRNLTPPYWKPCTMGTTLGSPLLVYPLLICREAQA